MPGEVEALLIPRAVDCNGRLQMAEGVWQAHPGDRTPTDRFFVVASTFVAERQPHRSLLSLRFGQIVFLQAEKILDRLGGLIDHS